jgi:hypothetical protein
MAISRHIGWKLIWMNRDEVIERLGEDGGERNREMSRHIRGVDGLPTSVFVTDATRLLRLAIHGPLIHPSIARSSPGVDHPEITGPRAQVVGGSVAQDASCQTAARVAQG